MTHSDLDAASIKDVVRRHWAARAAEFDTGSTHGLLSDAQRYAWSARLQEWAGAKPLDVLDVGCGTGFLALQLAAAGHRATGVDAAEEMLSIARTKAALAGVTVRFEPGDAERLPFAHDSFDLVVERHVIWTLPDPSAALADWRRVLRVDGRVLLIEGDWRQGRHGQQLDYAEISVALPLYGGRPSSDVCALLMAAGFVDLVTEPLMDSELWGAAPERERYALLGRRSGPANPRHHPFT
jgi:ubiquinone/menaquinone biosynthesis C-methylase UbiE